MRKLLLLTMLAFFASGCAAPLKVKNISFKPPEQHNLRLNVDGLIVAVVPIDSEARSKEIFSTDLKEASVLPFHILVRNTGNREFEINHLQMFGVQSDGSYDVALTIGGAAGMVRTSSIGTTAVTGAVAGAAFGAAVGAGLGAGIGAPSGNSGRGAEAGAIIGGTQGAAIGTRAGLSDSFTIEFKRQLAMHAFEDKVIYPMDIAQGFVYLPWERYASFRMVIFDITTGHRKELIFPVIITR